ncbi:MAG: leucine-rich repeat domain-containing protein [Paludibacteraceae bacterium]|nr:leucine-rich repeat domain-containing protein [Paludibacteraceae bacterium]
MKKKLFTLLLAVVASVGTMFAARDVVPSDAVLANYYEPGQLCVCIFVPAELDCSQVVFPGTYNRDASDAWITDVKTLAKFEPVEGYDGWYVLAVNDETPADFQSGKGIQGKPVVLDQVGNFSWAYQVGDVTVIRGGVTVVPGFSREIDLVGYTKDAPNVFIINALKANANPCTGVYHNYTITVINDSCNNLAVPFIVGGMNDWNFQQMQLDQAKTLEYQVPVYTTTFKAAESTQYQILSGLMDTTGQIIEAPSWNDIARMQKLVDDVWAPIPGEEGDNQLTHEDANIIWDLRDSTLRWARCAEIIPEDSYTVNVTLIAPAGAPAAGVEIIGDFDGWAGTLMTLENGKYTATISATPSQKFKFREAGTWDNGIMIADAGDEGGWKGFPTTQFQSVWEPAAEEGKMVINLDLSNPTMYRWKETPTGTCGGNLTWTLVGSVLTISGTGAMADYYSYDSPWYEYRSSIQSVIIGDGVTSIGDRAFWGCSSLTSINVDANNSKYSSVDGVLFNKDKTTLVAYPGGKQGAYAIPNSVTRIGYEAFYGCSSLTSVTIPNSVTSIGHRVFDGCTGLTSVTIPNSVTSIDDYTFSGCSGLTSVTIPNSVTSIGGSAFSRCSGLTSVTIEAETPPTLSYKGNSFPNSSSIYVPCGTLDAYKTAWSKYASQIKYEPLKYHIIGNVNIEGSGSVLFPQSECEDTIITALPDYGYHFVRWNDGNTDNPRTIILASDTTFTAEFAKNTYTISTTSANPEWGTTAGDTAALYLDKIEISAAPNYGYHFVKWNDNNTSNPRTVSVTEDKTYTATFAKNVYTISTETNSTQGYIYGNAQVEYLDFNELTAVPNYGYHFTQWSDGLKDNPRIAQITQDTTFTAEFAYDRVGTCGKDLALVWSYDPNSKVLTIGNAGEFTENMQFGVEAPGEMEELVIGNSVTAIGENAFANISTLKKVTIGESVKTIHNNAFYNCVNLETIFNYRPTPTNAYSTAFDGVDKFACSLYVLPSSIDMYKAAAVWRDFYYTYAIGAEETTVTTNNVTVEPQDNAATVTWPTSENAATYTIEITKDGVVFCTLIFNANGQLTGIAFAPSRDGQAHAPAAIMTANGLQFTVTGLNSNTQYGYNLTAKDANDQTVATYSGSFTTTSEGIATGVEEVSSSLQGGDRGRLILRDGQVLILRNGKMYTMQGQEVK